jgi:hypothetical protein
LHCDHCTHNYCTKSLHLYSRVISRSVQDFTHTQIHVIRFVWRFPQSYDIRICTHIRSE